MIFQEWTWIHHLVGILVLETYVLLDTTVLWGLPIPSLVYQGPTGRVGV